MTIDEAIAHEKIDSEPCSILCTHTTNRNDCIECRAYHKQLAEWLEELKNYRDKNKMVVRVDVENMDSIRDKIEELSKYAESQYNKAVDDFVRLASDMPTVEEEDGEIRPMRLEEMAKQLKAGGDNA